MKLRFPISALALCATVTIPVFGQSTWNVTSGNWSTPSSNWSPAATPANDGSANIIFSQTGTYSSNVDTPYSIASLVISGNSNAYDFTLTGSALTIGATGLTESSAANVYISAPLSGAMSLTASGTGQLFLTGANTYTGSTIIDSGAAIWVGNGGTTGSLTGNVSSSGTGELAFGRTDAYTYSGTLSGSLAVDQNGTGTTQLAGTNTYSGPTTINYGTLQAGSTSAFGGATGLSDVTVRANGTLDTNTFSNTIGSLAGSGAVTLGNGTTLTVANTAGNTTFSGVISGGGSLSSASYILILSNANTYTGGTTITSGTLLAENTSGSATGPGPITITGGALQLGTGGANGAVAVVPITDNGTVAFGRPDSITFANAISGSGGVTEFGYGTGSVTLSGNNSYTGTTYINNGTVVAGSTSAFGSGPVTIYGTLNLATFSNTVGDITGDFAGLIQLGSATLTTNTTTSTTFGGVVSGAGSLVVEGSGDLTLTGTNTYSGGTTISGATLTVGDGSTAGARIIGNILDNGTLELQPASTDNLTYSGAITGSGGVWLNGTGIIVFANPGGTTYSGLTKFDGGTLSDAVDFAYSPNSAFEIEPAATLLVNHNEVIGDLENGCTGGGPVTIASGKTLTIGAGNAALAPYLGTISGGGGVVISTLGTNSQGLAGASTYTGGTLVSLGELYVGSSTIGAPGSITSGPLGTGTVTFAYNVPNASNTELSPTADVTLANAIVLSGGEGLDNDDGGSNNLTLTGPITETGGSGSIIWCTTGTLSLTHANSFTGGVDMREGMLLLGSDSAAGTGTITMDTGTVLAAYGGPGVVRTLSNNISITGSSAQFGYGDDNNLVLNGTLTGESSVTYMGGPSGHLTLTGANSGLSGPFTISSGTVNAGNNQAFGSSGNTVSLTGNAGLNVMSGVTTNNPLAFSGMANVLSGDGTVGATVTVNNSVVLDPSGTTGNGPGNLTFTSPLTLATGGAIHFDLYDANGTAGGGFGLITADGGLSLTAGTGTITLNVVTTDASGNAANALNFNPASSYSWMFATSTTAITGFTASQFDIVTSGSFLNNANGGTFSVSESGDNLFLNFTPVPEPSTWAMIAAGGALVGLIGVRRRPGARQSCVASQKP